MGGEELDRTKTTAKVAIFALEFAAHGAPVDTSPSGSGDVRALQPGNFL